MNSGVQKVSTYCIKLEAQRNDINNLKDEQAQKAHQTSSKSHFGCKASIVAEDHCNKFMLMMSLSSKVEENHRRNNVRFNRMNRNAAHYYQILDQADQINFQVQILEKTPQTISTKPSPVLNFNKSSSGICWTPRLPARKECQQSPSFKRLMEERIEEDQTRFIIEVLRRKLSNDKLLKIRGEEESIPSRDGGKRTALQQESEETRKWTGRDMWDLRSVEDVLEACTKSKEASMRLQEQLERSGEEELERVVRMMELLYDRLVSHVFGSYVLQKLISISARAFQSLQNYCCNKFALLVLDGYASRTMEYIINTSPVFCNFANNYFASNFHDSLHYLSAVFLIIACIKKIEDKSRLRYILVAIEENRRIIEVKEYQRVLVSYLQISDPEIIDHLRSLLAIAANLVEFLNNKFTTYIILTMLQRNNPHVVSCLCSAIDKNFETLIDTRFFKLLLIKIVEQEEPIESKVRREIGRRLERVELEKLERICYRKAQNFYFYLYVMLMMMPLAYSSSFLHSLQRNHLLLSAILLLQPSTQSRSSSDNRTFLS